MRIGLFKGWVSTAALAAVIIGAGPALAQQQAPMLDDLVASGDLPPLEERLPSNPLVVEPVESIGTYGGTWRSALRGGLDNAWIARTVAYDGLVRYNREWDEIIPNLAESWEISEDSRTYTFKLREGLKWNNGTPFTSEDIAFAVELFSEPGYGVGSFIKSEQNPVSVEVIDDTTFSLVFEKPNGVILDELAGVGGLTLVSLSKDYCSQFYPKYNESAAEEAQAAGFQTWELWMEDRCGWATETIRWANPELPFMNAWMIEEPLTGTATRATFVRNPYYWKVDTEGNQLPYIDRLTMRVSDSVEEITLMALNGEIDFQDRHIATVINQPIFFDGQEQGDYRLGANIPSSMNTLILQFNLNHVDEKRRELFANKDFRIGVSHLLDREEIIDVVFTGQGEPFQAAPRPESPYYDEEMAKQYTEFDPDAAAAAFEAAGLVRNGEFYTFADGTPLNITIDMISTFRTEWVDMMELLQLQLGAGGLDIELNNIDRTLYYEKRPAGDFDAQIWQGDGGLDVVQEPRYYMPSGDESVWAYRWAQWYQGARPEIAEEPADWAREQMELMRTLQSEGDAAKRDELMKQILAIAKENFPVIGVSLPGNGYYIAKNNLRNVAEPMLHAYLFPTPGPYDPFQWYFAQE
ncbi:peptide/nickel transport system substrate-binding protein [Devosia crocina]|uniref:Peptide/nickel transport system substrate-binding protein n=1 Tax=Devosia crocina TaxID=429728 RepID=A0A1I7N3C2_9HYPH|nr:ABC transporter substrate-binding protein [Devosia crocina]SFV29046.1 peptide/nickel transport system substrate-binding protein [Devosia crocina]